MLKPINYSLATTIEPELLQRKPRRVKPTNSSVWTGFCAAIHYIFRLLIFFVFLAFSIALAACTYFLAEPIVKASANKVTIACLIAATVAVVPLIVLHLWSWQDNARRTRLKKLKQLVKSGNATVAEITDGQELAYEDDYGCRNVYGYRICYGFLDEKDRRIENSVQVEYELYKQLIEQQITTVLYDANKPESNSLYVLAPYRAVLKE